MSRPLVSEPHLPADVDDECTAQARVRLGRTVCGRWRLDSLLGVGGMAAVYAATHRNGNRVALKVLHPELATNPAVKQRFLDEGYVANRVGHPSAVSVVDDGISEYGEVFLVMDLLEGETLDNRIRMRGPMAPGDVLEVADCVLDVLALAHEQGVVHRDVKPENVFLTLDGGVRLLDFGIARWLAPGRRQTTEVGAPIGTPAFMSPEQARGRWAEVDGRADIWALGATMFAALTGLQVHPGETSNEALLAAMTSRAPSLRDVAPGLRPELVELVDRALRFEIEERWPDARAMQEAARKVAWQMSLRPVSSSLHPTDSTPPLALATPFFERPERTRAQKRAQRAWLAVLTAAIVSIAFLVLQMGRHSESVFAGADAPSPDEPALDIRPFEPFFPAGAASLGALELAVEPAPPLPAQPAPKTSFTSPPRANAAPSSSRPMVFVDPLERRK